MNLSTFLLRLSALLFVLAILGDSPTPSIVQLRPPQDDSTYSDQAQLFLLSTSKDAVKVLDVATQWEFIRYMDLSRKDAKQNFPRDFYKMFDQRQTIERLAYRFRFFGGYAAPETLAFSHDDTVSIRKLWTLPAFNKLAQNLQEPEVAGAEFSIRGWRDSAYAPVYDDPASDGRSLYKIHVQLIPGRNTLYFEPSDAPGKGIAYATTFTSGATAAESHRTAFHNSALEQECTTCHEGLPSADSGASMKADCSVCHKTFSGAAFVHAPVEMKECSSCHKWSAEKKSVETVKEVPELCYDCHPEKKTSVEQSAVQHPVASECLTCHSQHGTNFEHQLKADVYTLCSSCHPTETLNHPVGRHPVRFAVDEVSGKEVTCVRCHDPHGSANASLLKTGGGRMVLCLDCHRK